MDPETPARPESNSFFELLPDESIREVDMMSGKVLRKAPSFGDMLKTGELDISLVHGLGRPNAWKYTQLHGDVICQLLITNTFKKICEMPGMPAYAIMARWRAENPDFDAAISLAMTMRADHYADLIAADIEDVKNLSKDEVPGAKLRFDKLKWLAAVGNPDRYGQKTKINAEIEQSVTIIFDTGINREQPGEKQ